MGTLMAGKILIINNDETVRESFKLILSNQYELILTDVLDAADEILQNTEVKLILLDIQQCKKNKFKAIKDINKKYPKVKIITTTDSKSIKSAVESKDFGAIDYIKTPLKADDLLQMTNKI